MSKQRQNAREKIRGEILEWYLQVSGRLPEQQCEDRKAYKEKVIWWLEPLIPGIKNPVVVEETMGDNWGIRIDFQEAPIRVFMP